MTERERIAVRGGVVALAVWWLWMPLVAVLVWAVKHFAFGGFGQQDQSYVLLIRQEFFPHGGILDATPLFWVWVAVGLCGTVGVVGYVAQESGAGFTGWRMRLTLAVVLLALAGSLVRMGTGLWDDDKDAGRFYAAATVLDVPAAGAGTPRSVLPVSRAFAGTGAVSLRNLLAERFPGVVYSDQDIWGYCDGPDPRTARPVVVISVARQAGWRQRTVLEPAGVLVLRGSPDGRPDVTYRADVAPGELPGAVYPASVVGRRSTRCSGSAGAARRTSAASATRTPRRRPTPATRASSCCARRRTATCTT